MIVLGIDPGLVQTGYGLIKINGEKKNSFGLWDNIS